MLVGSSTGDGLSELLPTAATTMTYAALGALLSVVLALPVGLLVVRHASVTSTLVERSTYTANALPGIVVALALITVTINYRSEEHTSELQSLMRISYAVFCLKKKTTNQHTVNQTQHYSIIHHDRNEHT